MKNKYYIPLLLIGSLSLLIYSCEKDEKFETLSKQDNTSVDLLKNGNSGETAYADAGIGEFAGYTDEVDYINTDGCPDYGVYEFTLYAGKTNDAGTVVISNDGDYLYVSYNTNGTADLGEAHVYVWTDESQIPTKRPPPGQAPYKAEDINADSYTFMIPLSDFGTSDVCGSTFFISTHAALVADGTSGDDDDDGTSDSNGGETAYAGGSSTTDGFPKSKGAWWGYVTYTVECYYDISGTVYEDADNSFNMESDEASFEGITVNLFDAGGNLIATTITAADGSYLFEHVAGGADYSVVSDAPAGDYLANENAGGYSITSLSECLAEVDFGFAALVDCKECLDNEFIENGSFEDGLNGWVNNFGVNGYPIDVGQFYATDGSYGIDLIGTGPSPAGFVEQTLCTELGEVYVLTFDLLLTGVPSVVASLVVTIDGVPQTVSSSGSQAISFTAGSASTTIRLAADAYYNYLYNNVFLDNVSVACGDNPGPGTGFNETAYMFGNWSFCDNGSSRWGWANYIMPGQVITETVYAGAGQCDVTKGTAVGTATLEYGSNGTLTISIEYYSGYTMNNIHINIGDPLDITPNMTSNGNFNNNPVSVSYTTNTFSESYSLSGAVYVIIHMEAVNE